jgi:hypothetical protein
VELAEPFDNADEALLNDSNRAQKQEEDDGGDSDDGDDDGEHLVPLDRMGCCDWRGPISSGLVGFIDG